MLQANDQAVFLNEQGLRALQHLARDWIEGNALHCRRVEPPENGFVEVMARATALPVEETSGDVRLLIPAHFVDVIVLDREQCAVGFISAKS